jgi:hypothetical protein
MMCTSSAEPTPRRSWPPAVRIDLISPFPASSCFNAPQPSSCPSSHALQKLIDGCRSASRSSAWMLQAGECRRMSST